MQHMTIVVVWDFSFHGRRRGDWVLRFNDRTYVGWNQILEYVEWTGMEVVSAVVDKYLSSAGNNPEAIAYRLFMKKPL